MNDCKPIDGLVFDKKSQDALVRIQSKITDAKIIGSLTSIGVFNSIFFKSNGLTASYNIANTDWKLFVTGMSSIPRILRRVIEDEADMLILHYSTENNRNLSDFWKGVSNGCRY
jgi:hypothetical protein